VNEQPAAWAQWPDRSPRIKDAKRVLGTTGIKIGRVATDPEQLPDSA